MRKKKKLFFEVIINILDRLLDLWNKSVFGMEKFYVRKNLKKFQKVKSDYNFTLIVGCPRSGTTLLETILSTHPEIACPLGEIDFSNKRILKHLQRKFKSQGKKISDIFKEYSQRKHLIIKRPTAVFHINVLREYFPNMRIINIIRDGRDVVPSTINPEKPIKWPSYDFACRQWRKSIIYAREFLGKYDLELKYENLVSNPEKEINRILKFLEIKKLKKNKILNFHKKIKNEEKLLLRGAEKPITKEKIGKGRKKITEKQKKIFKKRAGKILIEEGYEENNSW